MAVPEILADADAEAANHSILRTARDEALDVINAPTQALLGPSVDRQRHRRAPGSVGRVADLAARPPQQ
ncbi:pE-PGRS family protein [Mycobacterium ulcerans str. Harvey]|uniref:PE-PGRS family protein n=1 Tax=Mycobacterium ulcerans str. Harvey TaxID=1299332 RepID=A0ABN0R573_MYCUL|nr:pE-PGRS family protein [Mycobacterium ulcerans str. Harvey]